MKKFLTLLLCLVMALSLIPTTAMAAEKPSVKYGTYGNSDSWTEMTDPSGSITYLDKGVTLSKTAAPTENTNEYEVTLQVVTKTTTTTTAASAATVLVIDTSGSMEGGRMTDAKDAAKSFLKSYSGRVEGSAETLNNGRYLAIVPFDTNVGTITGWLDVSNETDYSTALEAIDDLSAGGGTNLERGLYTANGKLSDSTVKSITNKYVIALTDGEPTFYGNKPNGPGSFCDQDTSKATIETATALKNNATLYTVCFGAAYDRMYYISGWPTVGKYLRDNIASSAGCAYNANNASELYNAFESITETITSGIDAGTVSDPLPTGKVVSTGDGYAETWELKPEDAKTPTAADGTTTYTYTKTYTVKIDPTKTNEDYQPLNEKTTFTAGETVLEFPVPAGKVTQPETVVTPASFTVKKIDADTGVALPGAEFTLTNKDKVNHTVQITTNADGVADFTCGGGDGQIPAGSYTLTETKAPKNYDRTLKTWTVSVSAPQVYNAELNQYEVTYSVDVTEDKAATDTGTENTSALKNGVLTVENKLSTGVITIQKVFAGKSRLDGDDIKSVKVNVLDKHNEVVATVTLNKENRWTATTEGLVYGTYTVKEVDASVVGYNLTVTYNYGGEGATAVDLNGPDANPVTITNSYAKQIIPRPTPTTPVEKISPKTADAGIAIYGVLSVMSVLGTGLVIGKKKEF